VARINQDQVISPQITLWSQQGSEVQQGTLMVIPIEESLIYVRPLYLRAQAGRIPELTRVIVAYQNRIVMDRTLDAAIAQLFGIDGARPQPATPRPSQPAEPGAAAEPAEAAGGASSLRSGPGRATRRRLGEVRRGNSATRRDSREDEALSESPCSMQIADGRWAIHWVIADRAIGALTD
jgi:uncharacterized membrane protein (UPF0182 family)